jgi:hypothetical protein
MTGVRGLNSPEPLVNLLHDVKPVAEMVPTWGERVDEGNLVYDLRP